MAYNARYAVDLDPEDEWLMKTYHWGLSSCGYLRRAVIENGRQRIIYLHREILGLGSGDPLVDHINGNKLDNRKCNLRVANKSINRINTSAVRSDSRTGVKGVTQDRRNGRFHVYLKRQGKKTNFGSYQTLKEAAVVAKKVYEDAWA